MVDDDRVILKIGKHMLMDKFDVYPFISSAEMFKVLEKIKPDLILLDINMPEMDGIETLRHLKADERYSKVPVIFVTSTDDDKSVFEHLSLGAYSTVAKPFSVAELTARVENCLNDFFPSEIVVKEDDKQIILAVDDAPDVLRTVHLLLREKYKVYTLTDPGKLKEFLQSITPDLFLLDYKMPDLSGFDLIQIIRSFPEHKDTPIIMLTSEKTSYTFTEAIRLGACDYIVKPIVMEVLRKRIEKHVKNNQAV